MTRIFISLAFAAGLATTLAVPTAAAQDNTYYACTSGYSLQVKSGAARCYKAASFRNTPIGVCASKLQRTVRDQFPDKADACVSAAGAISVPMICDPRHKTVRRTGEDICQVSTPADIRAPSVTVRR